MAKRLIAKEVNDGIENQMAPAAAKLKANGVLPMLATVRVGEEGADISYEAGASKRMKELGLGIRNVVLPADIPQDVLISCLGELSSDRFVHGILLFQPLPNHMDDALVKMAICAEKDVDCATMKNLASVMAGWSQGFAYCAPVAVMELLDYYQIPLEGAKVTIVGSGLVVGKPLSMMLLERWATVTMCNVYTKDTPGHTKTADILISAAGVAGLIDERYVSPGQIVIDVGTTFRDGKLYGDVNLEAVDSIVEAVTPTPGGISGITNTVLAKHVVLAAQRLHGI